ncbi:MAG: cation-transporting P-type ATPase [Opitutaceae bacterium]|nr:cation-transporting P-type ATPase [Opitutaceae bacterium]
MTTKKSVRSGATGGEDAERPDGSAPAWHQLESEEVVRLLEADLRHGLTDAEVRRRQKKFGPNRVTAQRQAGAFRRFLTQFNQPLVYILLVAVVITGFLAEYVDSAVILAVVLINAVVGYLQESKAEKAIDALSRLVITETTVRRDGKRHRIPSLELVPGDVVLLQSGDRVPADLRLYQVHSLQVDESALTGESVPVLKHADTLALDTVLADRKNLAFAGTLVTYGRAEGLVWAIGDQTETGRIATLISSAAEISTPLTQKIAEFSKLLLWAILGLAALTFMVGLWRGEKAVEMFMAAVALAVGAIPEGLPAALTITLAIGVSRMAKRRAIIRNLPAVETLGSTTVICSDKTGTLTENQMTVQEIYAGGRLYEVTGAGYEPDGEVRWQGARADLARHAALAECLTAGVLCNDSQLVREGGRLTVQGDPTEAALIVAARKAGLIQEDMNGATPRVDMIPFESEHMFRATLHDRRHGRVIYKVGALERLLDRCTDALDTDGRLGPLDPAAVHHAVERMGEKGLRVLAFARRHVEAGHAKLEPHHVAAGLTFLGLQGMIDPARPEAITAVAQCRSAGIAVKMITGDHLVTARAIAARIGLGAPAGTGGELVAVSGRELDKLSDPALEELAGRAAVFARVAPEQKFRLVKALQARGHVVAMTGDGVNDAPAVKQADIGIAMGITGTDVAKGAADMILTDDNFASIEAAVEEGRCVFDNLTKFLVWTLPTNGGEALVVIVAIFSGMTLPVLPVQMLWNNMTTAVLLGLMLVFEPKEKDVMQRPPRDPREPILTFPLIMRTGLVTLITTAGALFLFHWEQQAEGDSLAEARTIVVNTIVMVETFYLFNCRSLTRSVFSIGLFSNPWALWGAAAMVAAQVLFTYAPFMNRLFHTAPIRAESWLHIFGVAAAAYVVVGVEKWIRFRVARAAGR